MKLIIGAAVIAAALSGAARAECGTASWYRHGAVTANGERFAPDGLTAAHRSLPFGTVLVVTRPDTGTSVTVRINDRGPFVKGRFLDLSRGAAAHLGMLRTGVARVCISRK